jgi:prepilin-type N-terminal cleavage/methylation domain-containing protein
MDHRPSAGYSLTELLVVVTIIGVLSLITIPAFMNFQRASIFKGAMRTFSTDLRGARANAIKRSTDIRIEIVTGNKSDDTKTYRAFESTNGTAWTPLNPRQAFTAAIDDGTGAMEKTLDGPVWLESSSKLPDVGLDGKRDIVFHPNGTADIDGGAPAAVIVMATDWEGVPFKRYNISITAAGQIKTSTTQCSDGVDNDGDALIDMADPQCSSVSDDNEA